MRDNRFLRPSPSRFRSLPLMHTTVRTPRHNLRQMIGESPRRSHPAATFLSGESWRRVRLLRHRFNRSDMNTGLHTHRTHPRSEPPFRGRLQTMCVRLIDPTTMLLGKCNDRHRAWFPRRIIARRTTSAAIGSNVLQRGVMTCIIARLPL